MILNRGSEEMSKRRIHFELNPKYRAMGYTVKANIYPDVIKELKRWNKNSAVIINQAIKSGDVKTAIKEMQKAGGVNGHIRELSAKHDKTVFDQHGNRIMIYDWEEDVVYNLDPMEDGE